VPAAVAGAKDVISGTIGAAAPVISGAKDVVSNTVGAVPATAASATSALGTGWQSIMQQVCKTTGRC
jgi:hypothetical protein